MHIEPLTEFSIYDPALPLSPEERSISNVAVILPLCVALIAGTGGAYSFANIELANSMYSHPVVHVVHEDRGASKQFSTVQQIVHVRNTFGLSMSDLASVFGVSRPTMYAWLSGGVLRPEIVEKLCVLSTYADDFQAIAPQQIRGVLRRPILNGRTLLEALIDGIGLETSLNMVTHVIQKDRVASANVLRTATRDMNNERLVNFTSVLIHGAE